MEKIAAIDLFCGAGGLTHGLEKAGIDGRLGIDNEKSCEYAFRANNNAKFLLKSVSEVMAQELEEAFNGAKIRLLTGCAPCQTFSTLNHRASESDERWYLLLQFSRLIAECKPELVAMENVPGLKKQEVFLEFLSALERQNYHVAHAVINFAEFGAPQSRKRLVLIASKLGPIELLSAEEFGRSPKTVRDAIGHLPALKAGETDPDDRLHSAVGLSPINLKRIIASKPGGTWRDWPRELVADCHKKSSGKTYPSVYGRMTWDDPAPTMTTQFCGFGNGRFGHPEQNRAISLREGALLQTFPDTYQFTAPGARVSRKAIAKLIGNAVPVLIGELIGESIIRHVEEQKIS